MNHEIIQGKLGQLHGKIKEAWGRLSDDDIALVDGKKEQFLGKVQEVYGLTKEAAQKRLDEMSKSCSPDSPKSCS